jgi:hypothetical protein
MQQIEDDLIPEKSDKDELLDKLEDAFGDPAENEPKPIEPDLRDFLRRRFYEEEKWDEDHGGVCRMFPGEPEPTEDVAPPPPPPPPQTFPTLPPNPAISPGPGWEWRGGSQGAWYNPNTRESLRPDLNHPIGIAPHWDYRDPNRQDWRIFLDGRVERKN